MRSHLTPDERFWLKVVKTETCWLWQASTLGHGYGQFWDSDRRTLAHRYAYEKLVGPIPTGMHLDHLCRVKTCVNPAHLEPVTPATNNERMPTYARRRTTCPSGHPYDLVNTHYTKAGRRQCRACDARRHRERRAARSLASQPIRGVEIVSR